MRRGYVRGWPRTPSSVGGMDTDGDDRAQAMRQAEANAAAEGIFLEDDERALIDRRARDEITHEQFLAAAAQMAARKSQEGT